MVSHEPVHPSLDSNHSLRTYAVSIVHPVVDGFEALYVFNLAKLSAES
jgi:hypothetical protein